MNNSIIRIQALIRRHLLLTFRTLDRILNILYWPIITLVVWGGNMLWVEQTTSSQMVNAVFFSMILWQIVYRVSLEAANSLFEELVSRNLVNLFSSPVSLSEWIMAIIILGLLNMILILLFGSGMLKLLFGLNILELGIVLPVLLLSLSLSGLAIGLLICAIFITWGRAVRDLMHAIVWLVGCFSAIYYPISMMPETIQYIAYLLPTTYSFEIVRLYVGNNTLDTVLLAKCIALNFIYFVCSVALFMVAFQKSKSQGLGRLE